MPVANFLGYIYDQVSAIAFVPQDLKNATYKAVYDLATCLAGPGQTPQGYDATVADRFNRIESVIGYGVRTNLNADNNAATPLSKIDVSWDRLGIGGYPTGAFSQTLDFSITGANGRDTAWTYAAAWLFLHAIFNPVLGTSAVIMSTNQAAPSPMPAGYVASRFLGAWRNTTTSAALRTQALRDDRMYTLGDDVANWKVVNAVASVANSWQTPTVTSFLPPTTRLAYLTGFLSAPGSGGLPTLSVRTNTGSGGSGGPGGVQLAVNASASNQIFGRPVWLPLDSAQRFQWNTEALVSGVNATINVLGWKEAA